MLSVGINGFGRIGRLTLRASLKDGKFQVVAINDLVDSTTLAHLLKYDSIYGELQDDVKAEENGLLVNGNLIRVYAERDPAQIPWRENGVDLVIEATAVSETGYRFRPSGSRREPGNHYRAGGGRCGNRARGQRKDLQPG